MDWRGPALQNLRAASLSAAHIRVPIVGVSSVLASYCVRLEILQDASQPGSCHDAFCRVRSS